ncbi:histone-lysine N-methyltransferase SETD1A [Neltuma alba]|uniref:histone-lysine N-methyltransferase SETD1A n=1 Tax=Neltuma alba TaxID=207710 RepID=UPI0010A47BD9|nr:histone-lysine N-methyltransferase SETD1A [Prosopis alba]
MKTHHHPQPKLKTQLFSCGFFRHCAQSVLSPTGTSLPLPHTPSTPPAPPPPPPPPPPHLHSKPECESSTTSSSSSSATSQSFTQWRFSLPTSTPTPPHPHTHRTRPSPPPNPILCPNLQELFHISELQLSSGSDSDRLSALHLLERSLVPNPPQDQPPCPPELMRGVISNLRNSTGAKPATKILFALCLSEGNRRIAVEAGAVGAVIESALELDGPPAERALAALELMCTVAEGQEEARAHALSVPVMVTMMGKMGARGKEYAIGVLAVIYSGVVGDQQTAPPEELARAVELALQGECSARGRRKAAQLLKTLHDYGQPEHTEEER